MTSCSFINMDPDTLTIACNEGLARIKEVRQKAVSEVMRDIRSGFFVRMFGFDSLSDEDLARQVYADGTTLIGSPKYELANLREYRWSLYCARSENEPEEAVCDKLIAIAKMAKVAGEKVHVSAEDWATVMMAGR